MMFATDVYENTSEALSAVIEKVLDDEEIVQPATLVSVREEVLKGVKTATIPLNRFSDDQLQELRDEIDYLIEEYGGDALAVRFLKPLASQALTQLIEAGIDKLGEPTLAQLFNELESGLLANLIAKGEIDDDEAQTVTAELQALIDKHGVDAIAEDFMRYL
jgi:polyhydroxyalkanoate synthesis regulator phasin